MLTGNEEKRTIMSKGGYVVTEEGCLTPGSGAFQHIRVGQEELGKHFSIKLLAPKIETKSEKSPGDGVGLTKVTKVDFSLFRGILRDILHLGRQTRRAFSTWHEIRKQDFDFIYYRACFLGPLPFLCRISRIPCFIEANGLQFESRKKYYHSPLESLNRLFERLTYRSASHVFFVGRYGDYWNLPGTNWSNVENGVEGEFLDHFKVVKPPSYYPVRLVFLGSLMQHHRPDILINAIKQFSRRHRIEVHLIGSKLGTLETELREECLVVRHGFLDRKELANVLKNMDIGLIPGAPEYQSQMKLFDYGAARLAVIAPDTHHLTSWHGDVLSFFPKGDASVMAEKLEELTIDFRLRAFLGNSLHDRIRERFTWERIFELKVNIIRSTIEEGC